MWVAKFVMSRASADTSRANRSIIAAEIRRSISTRSASDTARIASQNRRWSNASGATRAIRSPTVVAHQSANAAFEHGATTRPSVANAGYVPTDAPASARREPTTASTIATTSSSPSTSHTAATSPNGRCRTRSGSSACSRAAIAASISAAVPGYRSDTRLGLPSTRAISRR